MSKRKQRNSEAVAAVRPKRRDVERVGNELRRTRPARGEPLITSSYRKDGGSYVTIHMTNGTSLDLPGWAVSRLIVLQQGGQRGSAATA